MRKVILLSAFLLLAAGCGSTAVNSNTSTTPTTSSTPQTTKSYTMAEVQSANTPEKCWTVIRGNVYDVTAFINKHPGGDKNILKLCGLDGTQSFEKKHGGQQKPENTLKGFEIGVLK